MTEDLTLELPSERRCESYRSLVAEFRERNEPLVPFSLGFDASDFPALLQRFEDSARGCGVPDGFVPHQTFWLIAGDSEVVAVSNLRMRLTDALRANGGHIGYGVRPSARRRGYATAILSLTLEAARLHGIHRCLLTYFRGNIGSARAIERNGGVFEEEAWIEGHSEPIQRYWIDNRAPNQRP